MFLICVFVINLEAEWYNKYPRGRTLDIDYIFVLGKADILSKVTGLQTRKPAKWETLLMDSLWDEISPRTQEIFVEAAQGLSSW